MDLKELFLKTRTGDYQRDNFDNFLKDINFSFDLKTVHITGTNGKGSTAKYISNCYIRGGYKVGLFLSPYLIDINEMISIDNSYISSEEFIKLFNRFEDKFLTYNLSEFEIQTFLALTYFKEQECDLCIIECGMGGELDATNIFKPILSIITTVGLEHTSYLGKSYSEIAFSKSGIIKNDIPILIGKMPDEAKEVIVNVAIEKKSKVIETADFSNLKVTNEGFEFSYSNLSNLMLNCKALYAIDNACLAIEAINYLNSIIPLDNKFIYEGLNEKPLLGRFSIINDNPTIIVDGAHNPEGCHKLFLALESYLINRPLHIIFACFKDKNIERMLAELGQLSKDITLTSFNHARARNEEDYFLFLGEYSFEDDWKEALAKKAEEFPNDVILLTGSLAFAGLVLKDLTLGKKQ